MLKNYFQTIDGRNYGTGRKKKMRRGGEGRISIFGDKKRSVYSFVCTCILLGRDILSSCCLDPVYFGPGAAASQLGNTSSRTITEVKQR